MKLYYSPGACSLASDIVLHEMKVGASYVKVDLKTKKTENGDDYKAINPKGYVPALQLDGGDLLTENVAILEYLASLQPALLPQEGMSKWHAVETLAFVSTELHKSFKPLFDPSAPDDAKQKAKDHIAQRLGLLVPKMGDHEFVLGKDFSVVDAYLFVMLMWAQKNGVNVPERLVTYSDGMKKRPSVQEALKMEGLAPAS